MTTPRQQAEDLVREYERVLGPITNAEHRAGLLETIELRCANAAEIDGPSLLGLPIKRMDDEQTRQEGCRE